MEVGEDRLESQKIVGREPAADVDVLRGQRYAMRDSGKPSDDHELDAALDEAVEERLKVGHDDSSSAPGA